MRPGEAKRRALLLTWLLFSVFLEACCVAAAETGDGSTGTEASVKPRRQTKAGRRAATKALKAAGVQPRSQTVPGCSIYIVDVNAIGKQHGLPQCDLNSVVVDAKTQVPYLREFSTSNKDKKIIPSPHYFSGNSAPWFTRRAVERSPYWTQDPANATVYMVDDYCFKLWWLSYIHSDKKDQAPGEALLRIYEHMMQQPEWVDNLGSKHVFFQSHTGFAHGPLGDMYEKFLCVNLANSMHIVNVRASRLRCKTVPYNPDNILISPGSVQYHDIREFQEKERERLHNREGSNYHHERDFLLFFKGKCTPLNFDWKGAAVENKIAQSTVNVGKLMRFDIVKQIQGMGRDIRVACTGNSEEIKEVQNERPHWEQMDEFTRSTFCMLLPGDSQTSRRLPEAIMAGCIPVFPGPPFHTLPIANMVDYSKFALFFQLNNTPWADTITVHWKVEDGKRPHHPTDSEWWVPDIENIQDLVIHVNNAEKMVQYLRDMPDEKLALRQQAVLAVQPKFAYLEHSEVKSPNAADLIVKSMCERWQRQQQTPPPLVSLVPFPRESFEGATRKDNPTFINTDTKVEIQKAKPRAEPRVEPDAESDPEDAADSKEGEEDQPRVAVRRGELVDPAGSSSGAAQQQKERSQSQRLDNVKVTVAEELKPNGEWEVSNS